jgi:hypothetical protein
MARTDSGHLMNDLNVDAWGRQKSVIDKSLLHGLWTFNVPSDVWYETVNDVVQASPTNCVSSNGELQVTSGATLNDATYLRTLRNPRYEPNRGHLHSTAMWFNDPDAAMVRRFGMFTPESGVFWELDNGVLYAVVRTTYDTVTTDTRYTVNTDLLSKMGVDLSKGNVFDIQFQWRGVGNYVFFINLQEVLNTGHLGTVTRLSTFNPACPIAFESINEGANDSMHFGCVDVTSEGGGDYNLEHGSVTIENESGSVAVSALNSPVLAIRSKIGVNSLINTRDTLLRKITGYADQRSIMRFWGTRDLTAITDGTDTWSDYGDGHLEYMVVEGTASFDITKANLRFGARVMIDRTHEVSLIDPLTKIWMTPGDMFVVTMHRETANQAANVGATIEFLQEI